METCASCRAFAENARETIHALRAIPIAAERSLVSTTQMRVRRRALECALLSAVALWRGFEWLGARAQLAPSIWQVGFLVFCLTPALIVGVVMLARDTHLADHTGSYEG